MYHESGTIAHTASQWRHTRSAGKPAAAGRCCVWSSERREDVVAAILKVRRRLQVENPTRLSMRIYVKNNPAKFHPDPIRNDGALGC